MEPAAALTRYADFASQHLPPRHVEVWCPPGYDAPGAPRYPVLYMHDGQNLFTGAHAFGGQDWGVVPALTQLMAEGAVPGALIVGVWNTAQRRREYMPARPLAGEAAAAARAEFAAAHGGPPVSDAYLRFLVTELKPFIDARYRTRPERAHTVVMGSSMGGLISLYALTEYPEVFGGAGCLSTHWSIAGEQLVPALGAALPPAGAHRLYFDYGTEGLDAAYEPYQLRMDDHLRAAGYVAGRDWLTRKFEGAEHSERAWRARVHLPLRFLLAP